MNDQETASHIRKWIKDKHSIWSWPTDLCGYEQHIRFVRYRNKYWDSDSYQGTFDDFVSEYAEKLSSGQIQFDEVAP